MNPAQRGSVRIVANVTLAIFLIGVLAPIALLLILAFQPDKNIVTPGWHVGFTTANLTGLFGNGSPFATQLGNSVEIVIGTVVLCLGVGTLAAYSLSHVHWSRALRVVLLVVAGILTIIPPMALVPGLYHTLQDLGVLGSVTGLILLNTTFNLPFAVVLLKTYYDGVPEELREVARIDGASEVRIFLRVMTPLIAPGLGAVAIYVAIMSWNEFLFGLTMTSGGTTSPITVGIASLLQPYSIDWGRMAAAGAVTAVPILVIAVLAGRGIVRGLTQGAVKG